MKHRITQIILSDGKKILNPSDEELKQLNDQIERLEIVEYLTKEEWNKFYVEYMQCNIK